MEASGQNVEDVRYSTGPSKPSVAKTSYIPEGVNVTNINQINALDAATIAYLNASITIKGNDSLVTPNTVTFLNTTILEPPASSQLPPTSVNDFKFFVNGVFVDATNIISFVQSGADTVLTVNTTTLGYTFDSVDEIIAVGKFE
jgi:hypothetical protein